MMLFRPCFAAMMLLSTLLAPMQSQAEALYTALYNVNLLPGVDFAPTAMNNAGQIVGFAGAAAGGTETVVYANGALQRLGAFGGVSSYGTAINDAGTVTGSFQTASGESHGFLYQEGHVIDIGAGTSGHGINARGDVVGSWQRAGGVTPFMYSGGKLIELANLGGGKQGSAIDIDDAGNIAGESTTTDDTAHASVHPFLYRNGTMVDLGALGSNRITGAVAINNAGQVAGYSEGADGTHAFLYETGIMHDLGNLGSESLSVHGMNAHGTLVGTASNEEQGLIPFISVGNTLVDLNTLIDPLLGWQIFSAYANNDLGQVIGWGCQGETCGLVRLDLATAVPEPARALLLAAGVLLLFRAPLMRARRQRWMGRHVRGA
jgi:probable HAF family extracellular repeat protein